METSILTSTKKILGLAPEMTAFDLDILTHINAVFSVLAQIGIGDPNGFYIEDASATWDDFGVPDNQTALVRTYVFVKVKSLFDPSESRYYIQATEKQLEEFEIRLRNFAETDFTR